MKKTFLFCIILCLACVGCRPKVVEAPMDRQLAIPGRPLISPSGMFRLAVIENKDVGNYWTCVIERVGDGHVEYTDSTRFYIRHTTLITWGKDDVVWVYSGDIGVNVYQRDKGGAWQKNIYHKLNDAEQVPQIFKKMKPNYPW